MTFSIRDLHAAGLPQAITNHMFGENVAGWQSNVHIGIDLQSQPLYSFCHCPVAALLLC